MRSRVNLINSVRFLLKSPGVFVSSSIKAMACTRKVRAQLSGNASALVLSGALPMWLASLLVAAQCRKPEKKFEGRPVVVPPLLVSWRG